MSHIELKNISKIYKDGENELRALDNINLNIDKGEMIAVMGPSGSGKSTLLNILGCMDKPTSGEYILDGNCVQLISQNKLWKIRNKYIGFVFQYFALLKEYKAIDNVALPLLYADVSGKERTVRSMKALESVGLKGCEKKKPPKLSGGQQQRVAIARAIVNNPEIILADEPTGALDQKTGEDIINLLVDINKEFNKTIIIVTHDMFVAKHCNKIINIKDGKIE